MTKAVLGQQGLIEEAGYEQQAASYRLMSEAANQAATAADHAAQGAQLAGLPQVRHLRLHPDAELATCHG